MPTLTEEVRLLEEAIRRCQIAKDNYNRQIEVAERLWSQEHGPLREDALRFWPFRAAVPVYAALEGGYTGSVRRLAEPVGVAARLMHSARRTMLAKVNTVQEMLRNSRPAPKAAEHAAVTLEAAAIVDQWVTDKIENHNRTRWALNDPAHVPLILAYPRLPGTRSERRSWVEGLYRTAVGDAYADNHPLEHPPDTEGDGGGLNIMPYVGLAAGVVGGIGIIWLLSKVGI